MTKADASQLMRVAGLRYWKGEDARVVVAAWRQSGDTVAAFSRRYGVHPRRLRQWIARLDAEGSDSAGFHPVRVRAVDTAVSERMAAIEIVFRDGPTVRVTAGTAAEDLERVLAVVTRTFAC